MLRLQIAAALGLSGLLEIVLDATLLSLALGTLLIISSLLLLVASEGSDSAAEGALDTVADARAKVVELTLGLLVLSLEVLLAAGLLQRLYDVSIQE